MDQFQFLKMPESECSPIRTGLSDQPKLLKTSEIVEPWGKRDERGCGGTRRHLEELWGVQVGNEGRKEMGRMQSRMPPYLSPLKSWWGQTPMLIAEAGSGQHPVTICHFLAAKDLKHFPMFGEFPAAWVSLGGKIQLLPQKVRRQSVFFLTSWRLGYHPLSTGPGVCSFFALWLWRKQQRGRDKGDAFRWAWRGRRVQNSEPLEGQRKCWVSTHAGSCVPTRLSPCCDFGCDSGHLPLFGPCPLPQPVLHISHQDFELAYPSLPAQVVQGQLLLPADENFAITLTSNRTGV